MSDTPRTDELREKSKLDNEMIVGSEIRAALQELEKELEQANALLGECEPLLEALGHTGIDFGYGVYQPDKEQVGRAQKLHAKLKERDE